MVSGMLITLAEVFLSGSSGGAGVFFDVSMSGGSLNVDTSDFRCAFLVGFPLDFCEGVFDFCEAFEDFPVVRDLVFGGPERDFCDDFAAFGGIFTDVC